jgi:nitroreductase
MDVLKAIEERKSTRAPFDPKRRVGRKDLKVMLEAARWSPTPHNMQNFEILVIDSEPVLREIGKIRSKVTLDFLRENYSQLSFSREELMKKGTGILAEWFPKDWTDPKRLEQAARKAKPWPVSETLDGSPLLLIVMYDPRKRAPDSPGDFLGIIGLGCVMENMWLMANSLGIAFHIMSEFGKEPVESQSKKILGIPKHMKIAYACRLGYPIPKREGASGRLQTQSEPYKSLRVRRELKAFTHHNRFGKKGLE